MLSVKNDRTYGAPTVNKIRHCSYIFFFFFHLYYNSLYVSIESFSIFLFFFPHNNPYRVSLSGSKRTNCAKIIRIKIALSHRKETYIYISKHFLVLKLQKKLDILEKLNLSLRLFITLLSLSIYYFITLRLFQYYPIQYYSILYLTTNYSLFL